MRPDVISCTYQFLDISFFSIHLQVLRILCLSGLWFYCQVYCIFALLSSSVYDQTTVVPRDQRLDLGLEGFETAKESTVLKEIFIPGHKEFKMSVTGWYLLYWQGIKGFDRHNFPVWLAINRYLFDSQKKNLIEWMTK